MSGFNYQEPDDGNTLAAIRSSSGLFYFNSEFEDEGESFSVCVTMSPMEAERFAKWILDKVAERRDAAESTPTAS